LSPAEARSDLFSGTSHSPSLADLVGYDAVAGIIDFCFIANPYYPTPEMVRGIQERLPTLIKHYPSSNPMTSQRYLGEVLGVNPARLLLGNGATELIVMVNQILVDRLGVPVPTFGEYIEKIRDERAADLYMLDPEQRYQLNLDAYLAWARGRGLRALLVINPGNPTGQFFSAAEMARFLRQAQDLDLVVVDESFIDFGGHPSPSLLSRADQFRNLLIVQSMSKHCGIPGLRLGFAYSGNDAILERLRGWTPTWNLNTMGEYLLSLLPSTIAEYRESTKRVTADVRILYEELASIPGLWAYPTGANFVLIRIENGMTAAELQAVLLEDHRMYVRDCSNKVGMDACHVRIASQGREQDAKLIEALRLIVS
jgi:histidinol-phosphate/aromatic aminotransferase/cobyric acid decarboxylase-like protein